MTAKRAALTAREQALAELRGQLFSFEGRYIRQVGVLYKQLDEWEERIAELHAGKQSVEVDEEAFTEELTPPEQRTNGPEPPDLKAMFRELAKRIHPDFASDAADERRRTRLMAQANDALRRKDMQALQRMLNGFDVTPAGTGKQAVAAALAEILEQIQQVERDIASVQTDQGKLAKSELAKLQQQTVEAALNGRDLLAEMAARVKGRIGLTMRQYELDLDRIKHPPKGLSVESLVTAETFREPSRSPRYDAKRRTWVK